eukprot:357746-Chlamydomonas_euryale.AAC.1
MSWGHAGRLAACKVAGCHAGCMGAVQDVVRLGAAASLAWLRVSRPGLSLAAAFTATLDCRCLIFCSKPGIVQSRVRAWPFAAAFTAPLDCRCLIFCSKPGVVQSRVRAWPLAAAFTAALDCCCLIFCSKPGMVQTRVRACLSPLRSPLLWTAAASPFTSLCRLC